MLIERTYTFEAAHYLPHVPAGHKCRAMHGHTYRITLIVSGPLTDGMVLDFMVVDAVVKPLVQSLDHSCLNDTMSNPTAELIAVWFAERVAPSIPSPCRLLEVRVQETDRGAAIWEAT